jgi:hypothetical protein
VESVGSTDVATEQSFPLPFVVVAGQPLASKGCYLTQCLPAFWMSQSA